MLICLIYLDEIIIYVSIFCSYGVLLQNQVLFYDLQEYLSLQQYFILAVTYYQKHLWFKVLQASIVKNLTSVLHWEQEPWTVMTKIMLLCRFSQQDTHTHTYFICYVWSIHVNVYHILSLMRDWIC